jgi:hypothetical protein
MPSFDMVPVRDHRRGRAGFYQAIGGALFAAIRHRVWQRDVRTVSSADLRVSWTTLKIVSWYPKSYRSAVFSL